MKKFFIFLMILIPLVVIFIVNVTVDIIEGVVTISVDSVVLDKEYYVANINESFKLNAEVFPSAASDKTLIWSTSDANIATVDDDGNVSFLNFGSVDISATSADGLKTSSCHINITDVRVHSIEIYADKTTISVDESTFVWASVVPSMAENQSYSLKSSNEEVLTISPSGVAYGKKAGTAIVTAKSDDGNYEASIAIDVVIPVESIKIVNPSEKQITIGSSTFYINCEINPINASNRSLIYSSSNTEIASISKNGEVQFKKAGSTLITVSTPDGKFSDNVKITYTGGYPISLNLLTKEANFDVSDGYKNLKIKYTLSPLDAKIENIIFSSNNPEVASVTTEGLVSVKAGGSAIISVKVLTDETTYLYDSLLINASQKIKSISFEEKSITITNNEYILSPKVFPETSTQKSSINYIVIEGDCANLSNNTLLFNYAGTVKVRAYLDDSIYDEVSVTYTGGYPSDINLENDNIHINVGESSSLIFSVYPLSASKIEYRYEIISSNPIIPENTVINLDSNTGNFSAISTGECTVRLYVKISEESEKYLDFHIFVESAISDIDILINEEIYENYYISALNDIEFSILQYPADSTETEFLIDIKSDNSVAKIIGNKIHFNDAGKASLTVNSKYNTSISKTVNIWYTAGYAVSARLNGIPDKIINKVTTFETYLTDVIPSNALNKSFSITFSNSAEQLLNTSYNADSTMANISAIGAGNITISAILSGSDAIIDTKNLEILQKVSDIDFLIPEGETPYTIIKLKCNVSPINSSVKNVEYFLDEGYSNIAYIEDNTLYFFESENEKESVKVIAKLLDVDGEIITKTIDITSTFGKIALDDTIFLTTNLNQITKLDYHKQIMENYVLACDIESGHNLIDVQIDNSIINIKSVKIGTSKLIVSLKSKETLEIFKVLSNITLNIEAKIEDVNLICDDLSLYNSRYYTTKNQIKLNFEVLPSDADLSQLNFEISDNALASFDLNEKTITFNKNGLLQFTISNADKTFVKKFIIQKTTSAVKVEFNLENNIDLSFGESCELKINAVYPASLNLTFDSAEEIKQSGETNKLQINNQGDTISIKAINTGKAQILITLSDGTTKSFTINCISNIERISFTQDSIITSEKNVTLKVEIYPTNTTNKNIKFFSADENIAVVNEFGLVTFIKAGTVEITAVSDVNNNVQCKISVTSTFGEISSFKLSSNEITLNALESRLLTIASIYPTNASYPEFDYKIEYQLSNNNTNLNVISVNNGLISALNGGIAIVSVSTTLSDGTVLKQSCKVNVIQQTKSIGIEFNSNLSTYQNYFVTSLNEVEFNVIPYPIDASIENINIVVDNPEIAEIKNNRLIFKADGIVKISAYIDSILSSVSIRHSTSPISYDLHVNNQIVDSSTFTINTQENIKFEIANIIPNDIISKNYSFELLTNSPNVGGDLVCSINNLNIFGLHGGTSKYKLIFNGRSYKEDIIINVIQKAEEIECLNDIKTSNNDYFINASIYPKDSTSPTLKFEILTGQNIATISDIGEVKFTGEGTIFVKISNEYSNISKTIGITYSAGFKTIEIDNAPDYVFIGKTIQLTASISPDKFKDENIIWEVDNKNLADISENGLLTPKKYEGKIKVSAYLENYPEVKTEKEIDIFAIITDIYLNEDSKNDNLGIEGTKVFGTHNFAYTTEINQNSFTNQFLLGFDLTHNSLDFPKLNFLSSDPNIATIDENGKVTVLAPGQVTISVYPKKQISNDKNKFVFDSYTFNFVEGVNIYSEKEFLAWESSSFKDSLYNQFSFLKGAIIQSNIKLTYDKDEPLAIRGNSKIYGNGYLLDLNQNNYKYRCLFVSSNTTIRNLNLRGYTFKENESIINIQEYDQLILTNQNSVNIVFEYCTLQNDRILIYSVNTDLKLNGCILENTSNSAIYISSNDKNFNDNYVELNSCVFENCLMGAVGSLIPYEQVDHVKTVININGFIDLYNWQPISLISKLKYEIMTNSTIQDYINSCIKSHSELFKEVNGEKYWHIGLFFPECNISFENFKYNIKNVATVNFNTNNNPYSLQKLQESFVIGSFTIYNYSLSGSSNYFIQPKVSYRDNAISTYEKIRKNIN